MTESLPNNQTRKILGNQLLRSATSIGANYSAACRSRSKKEFISGLKIVKKESDGSLFWLEINKDIEIFREEKFFALIKEADELTAIFTATVKTAKSNSTNQKSKIKNQSRC